MNFWCIFGEVHSWTARGLRKKRMQKNIFLRNFWPSFGGLLILLSAPRTPHKIGWFTCGSFVPRPNNSIVSGWHERMNRPPKMASIYGEASKTGWFIREKGSFVKFSRMNHPFGSLKVNLQLSEIDFDPVTFFIHFFIHFLSHFLSVFYHGAYSDFWSFFVYFEHLKISKNNASRRRNRFLCVRWRKIVENNLNLQLKNVNTAR